MAHKASSTEKMMKIRGVVRVQGRGKGRGSAFGCLLSPRSQMEFDSVTLDLFNTFGARFSACEQYRYTLWRTWSEEPPAAFVMLNPSTADESENDPTVERCQRRAMAMGYGGLKVANIFALRSTDPKVLHAHPDPVGPDNDEAILEVVAGAGIVICAWGVDGKLQDRGAQVVQMLRASGADPHYLDLNSDGSPKHPLYVSYEMTPKRWLSSLDAIQR